MLTLVSLYFFTISDSLSSWTRFGRMENAPLLARRAPPYMPTHPRTPYSSDRVMRVGCQILCIDYPLSLSLLSLSTLQ